MSQKHIRQQVACFVHALDTALVLCGQAVLAEPTWYSDCLHFTAQTDTHKRLRDILSHHYFLFEFVVPLFWMSGQTVHLIVLFHRE